MANKGDIADNPTTGESVQFDGTRWVPYADPGLEETSKADSFRMGALKALSAPARLTAQGIDAIARSGGMPAGRSLFPSMELEAGENYDRMMNENPATAAAGQLVGAVPAAVGAGLATPATLPGLIGGSFIAGAALDAEHPLMSGAISAAIPGGVAGISKLIQSRGAQSIVQAATDLKNKVPGLGGNQAAKVDAIIAKDAAAAAPVPAAAAPAQGAIDLSSVTGPSRRGIIPGAPAAPAPAAPAPATTLAAAVEPPPAAPGAQYLEGYMRPGELKALGIPATEGDALALVAPNAAGYRTAQQLRTVEERSRSSVLGGSGIEDVRRTQQSGFTDYIKRQLGDTTPGSPALTDTRMGRFFEEIGPQYDQAIGSVRTVSPNSLGTFKQLVADVGEQSTSESEKAVASFAKAFEKEIRNGTLSPESIQTLDRHLGKSMRAGMGQGQPDKAFDMGTLKSGLMQLVEESAPAGTRAAIQDLNRKYALGVSLLKRGARDTAGEVNAQTLRNGWNLNTKYSKSNIGQTELGRALETVAYLQAKVTPDSGTAGRIFEGLKQRGVSLATGGVL